MGNWFGVVLFVPILAFVSLGVCKSGVQLSASISGGEIGYMPEDDVGGSVGIYELGMHMQNKVRYFENGLQAEAGIHNGSPAFSVGFDFLPYVPIFQSNIVLAAGWGITLNSYSKEKFDISGQKYFRRVNDYAGVVKLQLEILKRLIGALEFMDDTEIFWKARLGYILIEI